MNSKYLYNLLKELQPFDQPSQDRIRIGSEGDGGYVLLDKGLEDIDVLYSYGVENNSDFERMFCENYSAIARLYDHTVDAAPVESNLLFFHKEGIGSKKTKHCNTLENHIEQNKDKGKNMILKMDVEGAEWDTLPNIPDAVFGLFDQLVIEIHFLHSKTPQNKGDNLSESEIAKKNNALKKITQSYYLYHVHANNYSPLFYYNGLKIPNCMELTFVNKKVFKPSRRSECIFPTVLDRPCNPERKDIDLHFWPFYPGVSKHIKKIIKSNRKDWPNIIYLIFRQIESRFKSLLIRMKLRRPTSYS